MKKKFNNISKIVLMGLAFVIASCGSRENTSLPETSTQNDVEVWLTKADESVKLQKQNVVLGFTTNANNYQNIEIDKVEKLLSGYISWLEKQTNQDGNKNA